MRDQASRGLLALLVAAGCGGAGTGPVPTDVAQDHCREVCQRDVTCDPTPTETVEECTLDCVDDVVGAYREDAFIEVATCIAELSCDAEEDACIGSCQPTSTHDRYEERCRERMATCDLSPTDLEEACEVTPVPGTDAGTLLCLLTPAVMSELTACFDGAECADVSTCFRNVLVEHGLLGQ